MPETVINRANEIATTLENTEQKASNPYVQQELFPTPSPKDDDRCAEFLHKLDLTRISPLDCFAKLIRFKKSLTLKQS